MTQSHPKPRIRVLINGLHARSGGGVTYLRNILPALAENADIECHLFMHAEQYEVIGAVDDRVRVHLFDFKPGIGRLLIWEQVCLPVLARLMGVDVTFSPANYGPLLAPRPIVMLRNALSVAGRETRPLKRLYWVALSLMTLLSLTFSRHAVAVSHFALTTLTFGFYRMLWRRVSVVYHGVSPIYRPREDREETRPFLLAVSDIYIQKNLHTLIEAMPSILAVHPELELVVAGRKIDKGYYDELVRKLLRLGLERRVRFVDNLAPSDLAEMYRRCTVFVFPSTIETFGNPLVEAMASGAAIACARTAAMPEIVDNCAEFFDPFNAKSISQAVLALLEDSTLRGELGRRGVVRAQQFTWKESAERIADIIRRYAPQSGNKNHRTVEHSKQARQ